MIQNLKKLEVWLSLRIIYLQSNFVCETAQKFV